MELIRQLIEEDARVTIADLCNESGLGRGAVSKIVKDDLGYSKKAARWVPRLLTDEHKAKHLKMARDILQLLDADPEAWSKV